MADNPITVSLPADLPEDWAENQIVAPEGQSAGLTQQHGYNYLMEQVNNAQAAITQVGEAFSGLAPMNNGQKAWAEAVTPVDGLEQPGVKLELSAGQTVDKAWAWEPKGAAWDPRAQLTTESGYSSNDYSSSGTPLSIADSNGLVFYTNLPSANTVCVFTNHTTAGDLTMKVGADYYVLAGDGSAWTKKAFVQGAADNTTDHAAVKFDAAFEGWVYIPWSSLSGTLDLTANTLVRVTWLPLSIETGEKLVFGPLYKAVSEGGTALPPE